MKKLKQYLLNTFLYYSIIDPAYNIPDPKLH